MALQIAYFCPHGQGHGRVSQPYVTHGQVIGQVSPGVEIKMKSVYTTRSHT
ncbi:hypothetical protein F383_28283 [Gossypium arboreum]|uniref:Uncharacterized protein n=1 Tax=Gossypium arboreum TaxID=29729 RepID=A0A0B0P7H2_GOSAR|nr:hypothetical protein F383_28283 [Gossypium arboreum]